MNLPNIFNLQESVLSELYVSELLEVNEDIKEKGLVLTSEDALQIINARNKVLKNYGRVELSYELTKKMIRIFSSSAFIGDEDFSAVLNELQEMFYYLKNETEDKLGDDRVLELMWDAFENHCEGSIQLLYGSMEEFSRGFRKGL